MLKNKNSSPWISPRATVLNELYYSATRALSEETAMSL